MDIRNHNVVVLGLGVTGLSAARWATREGARVRIADTRSEPTRAQELRRELPDVRIITGPLRDETLHDTDLIVISPGVPRRQPAIEAAANRGVQVLGDVEIFARAVPPGQKLLAVTGSNGKTTVCTLAGVLAGAAKLRTAVIGNIGMPVLDALAAYESEHGWPDVLVLELSSFQLETTTSLCATAAAVLNVSENHLDRYDGMDDYASMKARILRNADTQVLNRDDERSVSMALSGHALVTFGSQGPHLASEWGLVPRNGATWLAHGDRLLLRESDLSLVGRHNALNALAALAIVSTIAPVDAAILTALSTFRGLPHRMERVAEVAGVLFVNDSKGTTVAATQAALEGLGRPAVLIAGGDGKGQSFDPLKSSVEAHARAVILLGRDRAAIEAALSTVSTRIQHAATLDEAVTLAISAARPGDAVLLSPACASFDMFRDYVDRGEQFIAAVRAHAREVSHA